MGFVLRVMLCGAADVKDIKVQFDQVVKSIGGQPLCYLTGDISHINTASGSWRDNSLATVESADLCVFVVNKGYGEVTWRVEFDRILHLGRPYILLVRAETATKYRILSSNGNIRDDQDQQLCEALASAERDHQVTLEEYQLESFSTTLGQSIGMLLHRGIASLTGGSRSLGGSRVTSLTAAGLWLLAVVDGLIYKRKFDPAGWWGEWTTLAQPAAHVIEIAAANHGDWVDLFAVTPRGLHHTWYDPGRDKWFDWEYWGGARNRIAANSMKEGHVEIFSLAPDASLESRYLDDDEGGGWHGPHNIPLPGDNSAW